MKVSFDAFWLLAASLINQGSVKNLLGFLSANAVAISF